MRAVFSVHSRYVDLDETDNSEKTHLKIGLSDVDHSAYDQVMHEIHDARQAALADQRNSKGNATLKPIQAKDVYVKLQQLLSSEGKTKLDTFIQREKRNMVCVTGPVATAGGGR